MAKQSQRRTLRSFHNASPTKFHTMNQRIRTALTDNEKIPESTWAANPTLIKSYMATSEKHDEKYHQALYGSRLDISERDLLQAQLVNYLDEIASVLEAVAVRTPEVLLYSGFDLARDGRSQHRATPVPAAPEETNVSDHP